MDDLSLKKLDFYEEFTYIEGMSYQEDVKGSVFGRTSDKSDGISSEQFKKMWTREASEQFGMPLEVLSMNGVRLNKAG